MISGIHNQSLTNQAAAHSKSNLQQSGNSLQAAPADEMQTLFRDFVGKTLFGELMSSMHKTHDKAAYFHGGQAEEIFQQQLDQVMVDEITESSASQIADPMFDLFQLSRRG